MRTSSSEIRANQIDFTQLARNRMQTHSTKKMALPPQIPVPIVQQIVTSPSSNAVPSQF